MRKGTKNIVHLQILFNFKFISAAKVLYQTAKTCHIERKKCIFFVEKCIFNTLSFNDSSFAPSANYATGRGG